MYQLLPPEDKKALKREYYLRLLLVVSLFLLGTVFVALLLLIPSYVLSHIQKKSLEQEIAVLKQSEVAEDRNPNDVLKGYNQKFSFLVSDKPTLTPFSITSSIVKAKSLGVRIVSISMLKNEEGRFTVNVSGFADTREALRNFAQRLENESFVAKVELPVSNFAKDRNINFAFTILSK